MTSITPLRKLGPLEAFTAAVIELTREARALRAELRRERQRAANTGPLLVEIERYFGGGRFSVGGLLRRAEQDDAMADALALVIDMNLRGRAVALGRLLAREPRVRAVARRGNAVVYVLTEATEATQPV